jgi:tetratricopeptide (TPR) repeat protein
MRTQKERLKVIIFTDNHKIRGEVHLYENSRLTDILNADTTNKDFLPVTDAEITDLKSGKSQEVSFLSINRNHIEVVMEDDEVIALEKARDLASKRRYADALPFAQRAVKAAPHQPEGHYLLGFCLAKTGEVKKAKGHFEKCLTLKPSVDIAQKAEEILKTI